MRSPIIITVFRQMLKRICYFMKIGRRIDRLSGTILSCLLLLGPSRTQGQWIPPLELRGVPVIADCKMARHGIAMNIQPNIVYPHGAIFMCPERELEIDKRHPGAARFFLVHEYGHLALRTREETVADEWAAKQLSGVPSERAALRAVLEHFVEQGGVFDPSYGTGLDRALRVAKAAGLPQNEWPDQLVSFARSQVRMRANQKTLSLQKPEGYANAAQMTIFMDRKPLGFLSNVDEVQVLELPSLASGRHLLQAEQIWIYHIGEGEQKTEIARGLSAETEFVASKGRRLSLHFRYDGESVTIRVE
jgi:hypothetical protein